MENKIFILGYYGWNNTGDDAMLYSLLQQLGNLNPNYKYCVLSRKEVILPFNNLENVKFISHDNAKQVLLEIKHSSIFILGGGTHLYDYGNKKNRVMRLSQMLILSMFARLFCKKIYYIGIGVEPPSYNWGKKLIKYICQQADIIFVRDSLSYHVLEELGLKDNIRRSFDLAALLEIPLTHPKKNLGKNKKRILGISILPFFKIYHNDEKRDTSFIKEIALGLNQWLDIDSDSLLHLFVFKGKSKDDDTSITEELEKLIKYPDRTKLIRYNPDPLVMLAEVSECSDFIGMRYHSCLFAYIANLPLIVINYAKKNESLAKDIGLPPNAIISLDSILKGDFRSQVEILQKNQEYFIPSLPIDLARKNSWKLKEL